MIPPGCSGYGWSTGRYEDTVNMSARHILFVETEGDTLQTLMRAIAASHDD